MLLTSRHYDRVDRRASHVSDRAKSEANALVADHGKAIATLIDIRRQDLKSEVARFVDVFHHRIGVADTCRQQRGHELGRVVHLEVRGVVREHRVRHRVRLVEAIAAEGLDLAANLGDDVLVMPEGNGLLDKLSYFDPNEFRVLLADGFAQHVGFGE